MPRLTRWFIKTAFLYFVAALTLGVAVVADIGAGSVAVAALRPVFLHLFVLGWVTQMIFGVAFWMFPRASRERPRGSEMIVLATYITLNLGLLLRAAAEPAHAVSGGRASGSLLVASAALQWTAGLLFVIHIWGRVKER